MSDANRDRFLTVRWNNTLTLLLGVPGLIFAGIAVLTSAMSDFAAFVGVVVFSSFF